MSPPATFGPMRFDFHRRDDLPRLAWCAALGRGSDVVRVLHGPWVETADDFFLEGAWDGPYGERAFERAVTFAGSGGRLAPGGVTFAGPSHNLERLFSVRVGDALLVSNSMVFLFVRAGVALDMDHPNYFFDLLDHYRSGVTRRVKALRTASGAPVHLWDCLNLRVGPDLRIVPVDKDYGETPLAYGEYVESLQRTVDRVVANAADPARARPYRPLTSVSRGYDSAAVSVLAARAGCREAMTFLRSGNRTGPGGTRYLPDDGREIAGYLGLEVTGYERQDALGEEEPGPAEFYTNPYFCTEVATQILAPQLEGTLWMSGRHGEQFWDTDPVASQPWFRDPVSTSLGGASSTEARLRIGYLHFPVPYTRGVYAPALNRISRSGEMAPWSVGGTYDRPIARRLLESAGVPRELFGQLKMGGGDDTAEARTLPPRWEEDFLAFYRERVPPEVRAGLVDGQIGDFPYYLKGKLSKREQWLRTRPVVRRLAPRLLGHRGHHRWRSRYLYTFHWGFERTRRRYAAGVGAATPV